MNNSPTLGVSNQIIQKHTWEHLDSILFTSGPQNGAITEYEIWDTTGSNSFWVDGRVVDASNGYRVGSLSDAWLRGAEDVGVQTLYIRVFDGENWSGYEAFTVQTVNYPTTKEGNTATQTNVEDVVLAEGETIALQEIIEFKDAENDPTVTYEIWDSVGSSNWIVDGVPVNAERGLEVADLASIELFCDGSVGDQLLWVRAHDGNTWGEWANFHLSAADSVEIL